MGTSFSIISLVVYIYFPLQRVYYFLKSLAANLKVCKCIKACAGRGEKNAVAAYGRLGAGKNCLCEILLFDKLDSGILKIGMSCEGSLDLFKGSACENDCLYILASDESICKGLEGDILIVSAADNADGATKGGDCRRSTAFGGWC